MRRIIEEDEPTEEERGLINASVSDADAIMRDYLRARKRLERTFVLQFVLVLAIALSFGVLMIFFFPQMPTIYVQHGVYRNASFDFTGPYPKGSIEVEAQFDVVLTLTNYLPVTLQRMQLALMYHSLQIGVVELGNYHLFHSSVRLPQVVHFSTFNISYEQKDVVQDLETLASDLLKGQIQLSFEGEARLAILGIPFSFEYYREAPIDWVDLVVNQTSGNQLEGRAKYEQLFAPVLRGTHQPVSVRY